MNKFLKDDYKAPNMSDNYMKLQDGENKFRILSQPIMGWEDWADNKPMRFSMDAKPSNPHDPKKAIKHFWAFIVWNYGAEKIQILHVTQASVRSGIEGLCKDQDWGEPYFYDIKVMRKGEGMKTEYTVNPLPHKPTAPHIKTAFEEKPIDLEALMRCDDPFAPSPNVTPGEFDVFHVEQSSVKPVKAGIISTEKAKELADKLKKCDAEYQKKIVKFCKESNLLDDFSDMPIETAQKMETNINQKMKIA